MQKPMSSEKDGFTTWFFSMPFFNDDFLPSVTVGDKWLRQGGNLVFLITQTHFQSPSSQGFRSFRINDKAGFVPASSCEQNPLSQLQSLAPIPCPRPESPTQSP